MAKTLCVVSALLVLLGVQAPAQQFPPGFVDPAPLLAAAAKEIGEANFRCVTFSGTGYSGAVGQTAEHAVNIDWPRIDAMETTGALLRRTSMSGNGGRPVEPGGRLVVSVSAGKKS